MKSAFATRAAFAAEALVEGSQPLGGEPQLPELPGYRFIEEIAAGGLAVLYRGVQESLNRQVAIKALRTDVMVGPEALTWAHRFVREARILALLQHPNLVQVYDLVGPYAAASAKGGFPGCGPLYIIMELCEGVDLLELLRRAPMLPADVAVLVALGAAQALAYVHGHGILHRDVKPGNIFLTRTGGVKLIDFGAAWDPTNPSDVLGLEVGLGTPAYMSPEQALGARLDHRSDQFALGIVIYQMLAGRKPFAEAAHLPQAQAQAPAPARPAPLSTLNSTVPRSLVRVVERCLAHKASERYATTGELVLALSRLVPRAGRERPQSRLVRFLLEQQLVKPAAAADLPLAPFGMPPSPLASADSRLRWLRRLWKACASSS